MLPRAAPLSACPSPWPSSRSPKCSSAAATWPGASPPCCCSRSPPPSPPLRARDRDRAARPEWCGRRCQRGLRAVPRALRNAHRRRGRGPNWCACTLLGRAGATALGGLFVLPYVGSRSPATRTRPGSSPSSWRPSPPPPAATGVAHHARSTALAHSVTEQAFADTLLEHAARGERARIARELHDVVAHHISMIAVQAETARLTTPGLPTEGAGRLLAIGDTARTALTEMRRLLGVLREDAHTGSSGGHSPVSVNSWNSSTSHGTRPRSRTRLIISGPVTTLDPGIEVTAHRIVQEAHQRLPARARRRRGRGTPLRGR
ncbi:sensor histidine kinase [Streptomyces sp. L7]